MSTDRELLTVWLHASGLVHSDAIREWCECQQAADTLLPVVDRIANKRAAAALRNAAEDPRIIARTWQESLHALADALDPR